MSKRQAPEEPVSADHAGANAVRNDDAAGSADTQLSTDIASKTRHPAFTSRPDYALARTMPLPKLQTQASQMLNAGHLNLTTLWWHRSCWLRDNTSTNYLNYLICRRQLGYTLTPRHQTRVLKLLRKPFICLYLRGIRRHGQNILKSLLNEARMGVTSAGPQQARIQRLLSQQDNWQQQWLEQLRIAKRIHIVGNSPGLIGQHQGDAIDNADLVIRFNQFESAYTKRADIGSKISAWVVAPGYRGPTPAMVNEQQAGKPNAEQAKQNAPAELVASNAVTAHCVPVIIAGPAMLYIQQRLEHVQAPQIMHIPLSLWREQVRRVAAPPSAGALFTAWLLALKQQHQLSFKLECFGFGYQSSKQTRYHIALPDHQPVSRHNWDAEHHWMNSILNK